MQGQSAAKNGDIVALVNISTEKWPPRQRTYFGSLVISSPQPDEAFAITPIRGCLGVMDLGDPFGNCQSQSAAFNLAATPFSAL